MRATRLRGARTNNLRGVDLDIEPGTLVAIVGPSGAGKSSLAFSTLYAEGQRRYVESFSAYARQFLERLARPDVDELDPIAATVAVDRQAPVRTSRSTVGTMTEVADYAKSLWARAASLVCPSCGRAVARDEPEAIADELLATGDEPRVIVTYPLEVAGAEEFLGVREALVGEGYRRIALDGEVLDLDEVPPSRVQGRRRVDVVADRLVARGADRGRLVGSIEAAMARGGGRADVTIPGAGTFRYSRGLHCAHCDVAYRDASPGMFSFNSPVGACEECRGFGRTIGVDWDRVFDEPHRTLEGGAIRPWRGKSTTWERRYLKKQAALSGVPLDVPWAELDAAQRAWVIEGEGGDWPEGWVGLRGWFEWLNTRAYKMHVRVLLSRYRSYDRCAACDGARLKPESLAWKIAGRSLADLFAMPAADALAFLDEVPAPDAATALLVREVRARLATLCDVGLGYLTLDRASRTLSGGESQRVALTGALGASLTGAMFVLDEPTVGLHPVDVARLAAVVRRLTDGDNTVILVEHDADMIRGADRVVELGPGAGERGGRVVFDGTPEALGRADTPTGRALAVEHAASRPARARPDRGQVVLRGASGHNLRGVDVAFPIGGVSCVTGPSGSGKSSLVVETLVPAALRARGERAERAPLPHASIEGVAGLRAVVHVDQSPLGRTSRGNPATYLAVWNAIRKRFAAEPLAKERGYGPSTFSFNTAGGRCEACAGEGAETVEMQFLADVTFSCPECGGRRFVGPVLDVRHRGLTIADALDLTADEALARFEGARDVVSRLAPLVSVGLGYLRLGQPLNTLSGGEAQRLKLAGTLVDTPPGALVVLDEPTAGLHHDDVTPLLATLDALAARGDTVIVVEHDMRVAAFADHVVDLGPGAGADGGRVVAAGPPREIARSQGSLTAPYLARALGERAAIPARAPWSPRPDDDGGAIVVTRAREHNLRDVSIAIPREKLVVITGPSGSGKSTLAFDVIFAEGQRRYLETLSAYARQYMPQLPRPDVDRVAGVPPTVSLEQRTSRGGANSTVATVTEAAHYLRLLWARAGTPRCPEHGLPIAARSCASIAEELAAAHGRRALRILAPVVKGKKGLHRELLARAKKDGLTEAVIDGGLVAITDGMALARFVEHDVELVVAVVSANDPAPLHAALERAAELGRGQLRVIGKGVDALYSTERACPACGRGVPELDPRFFSFNTRQGACPACEGRGAIARTIGRGKAKREVDEPCAECGGARLSALARAVTVADLAITDVLSCDVSAARRRLAGLRLDGREAEIARAPLAELERRLRFLDEVGVGYLGLDRAAQTLSGGEMQRVRLAAQLGAGLTGLLYVLDEPTIGLHPRDTGRLLTALRGLVDRGNTVLVVEHDDDTIRAADHVVDVGPGGGARGGTILAEGPPAAILVDPRSVTGPALARAIPVPAARRASARSPRIVLEGASMHNLRGATARFPVRALTAVTGVSGSGKTTLVRGVLLPAVRQALGLVADPPGPHRAVKHVTEHLARAVEVDQTPIGRTPRSVPATYVDVWSPLRALLASTPDARARGWGASRFSFNNAEGRCPECGGNGSIKVEMAFLPDVHVPCDACRGMRFTAETLEPKLFGLSAGEILRLEIDEAAERFAAIPKVAHPLALLRELGLGYLELGQASNTLSGGEAQRLKLVAELGTAAAGSTLYVLDEPTTGLHRTDVQRLLTVLERFVARGDTVVVIEHHPDVIAAADWIVDLGPEGGEGGGRVVAEGSPEAVAAIEASHTGAVLRSLGITPRA